MQFFLGSRLSKRRWKRAKIIQNGQDHFLTEASLELIIVMEFCDSGDLRGEVKRRTQAGASPVSPCFGCEI